MKQHFLGFTITKWERDYSRNGSHSYVRYCVHTPAFPDHPQGVLFSGKDLGIPQGEKWSALRAKATLLSFLTLQSGDTDSEYFDSYTPDQLAWSESSECESAACDVVTWEEQDAKIR